MSTYVGDTSGKYLGVSSFAPVTFTNSNGATGSNFQQMLTLNSSTYSALETSSLSNVSFSDTTPAPIKSWLESGETSASTSSIYWLLLPSGIGASSTLVVNVIFDLRFKSIKDATTNGAEPNYTGTYGQYDNGATIFTYYQQWGGLSALPSGWTSTAGIVITFNATNTVIKPSATVGGEYGVVAATANTAAPLVLEFFGSMYNNTTAGQEWGWISASGTLQYVEALDTNPVKIYFGGTGTATTYNALNSNHVNTLILSNSTTVVLYVDYVSQATVTGTAQTITKIGFDCSNNGGSAPSNGHIVYWERERVYPPSGVMPTQSIGNIQAYPVYSA